MSPTVIDVTVLYVCICCTYINMYMYVCMYVSHTYILGFTCTKMSLHIHSLIKIEVLMY